MLLHETLIVRSLRPAALKQGTRFRSEVPQGRSNTYDMQFRTERARGAHREAEQWVPQVNHLRKMKSFEEKSPNARAMGRVRLGGPIAII